MCIRDRSKDPYARVACETLTTTNKVVLAGEIRGPKIDQEEIIEKVISNTPDQKEQFLSGKDRLFGFFVGQVMKESKGKANPKLVNEILKKKLV